MKKFEAYITLFLIIFSVVGISSIQSQVVASNNTPNYSILKLITSTSNPTTQITQSSLTKSKDYVIFAKTKSEFNQYLTIPNIKKIYPSLLAISFTSNDLNVQSLMNLLPVQVFPLDSYNQMALQPITAYNSSLNLNSAQDSSLMGVKQLNDMGYNGTGTTVAIVDNGVDQTHPGLKGQVLQEIFQFNKVNGQTIPPCWDHATPVAGTIVATGNTTKGYVDPSYQGNAVGAKVISVNMGCYVIPNVGEAIVGDLLGALDWVVQNNASINVLNTSWGGTGNWNPIVNRLNAVNITVVASAGNYGPDSSTVEGPSAAVGSIAVGAIDYNKNVTNWSSRGPVYPQIIKPDVVAPGLQVTTSIYQQTYVQGNEYGQESGTSFSSPLTAGAILTLISALNANNIPWNPGLLKAAIMRSATNLGSNELTQGQGLVNATKAFEYIMSASLDTNGMPYGLEMTPSQSGPIAIFQKAFLDVQRNVPFTIIASDPSKVSISITGNLSQILSFNPSTIDPSLYSQVLYLDLNTASAVSGTYTGKVTATLGGDTVSATYTFYINGQPKARMLFDIAHTAWSSVGLDTLGGGNTGVMTQMAINQGIWIDEVNNTLTPQLLSKYNIVWMPDPLDLSLTTDTSTPHAQPLTSNEINALVNFVNNGGSLFTDFLGILSVTDATGAQYITGTNATAINALISQFGILTSQNPISAPSAVGQAVLDNFTSPVFSSTYISQYGNYLAVSGNAYALASDANGITVAINDAPNKGRVMVTSTNFWMDNSGAAGKYSVGQQNVNFATNTLNWLSSKTQVKYVSASINGGTLTGEFQVLVNGTPMSNASVSISNIETGSKHNVTSTDAGNGISQFKFTPSTDGDYVIQVAYGGNYARWEVIRDTKPPVISPDASNPMYSGFPENQFLTMLFHANDSASTLNTNSFSMTLDGVTTTKVTYNYDPATQQLTVRIDPTILTQAVNKHWYTLKISAVDNANNVGTLDYLFFIGTHTPRLPGQVNFLAIFLPLGLVALAGIGTYVFIKRKKMN